MALVVDIHLVNTTIMILTMRKRIEAIECNPNDKAYRAMGMDGLGERETGLPSFTLRGNQAASTSEIFSKRTCL